MKDALITLNIFQGNRRGYFKKLAGNFSKLTANSSARLVRVRWSVLVGLLLCVGWSEGLQHRVVLGVEGLQLRILGCSGSSQDGVCKSDAV